MTMLSLSGASSPIFGASDAPMKALRAMGARARRGALRCAAGALAIAAACVLAGSLLAPRVDLPSTAAAAPVKPDWTEVKSPLRLYALESAEFGREPRAYQARRRAVGGGRQDTLTFGPARPGVAPGLRVSIYRYGTETPPDPRFFVEIARQAGQAGLSVTHSAQPGDLPTRFGLFQAADINLAGASGEAACLGFQLEAARPGLRISGYACGSPDRPIDRRTLACALDRLDLLGAAGDPDLARWFVATEQARGKGCGGLKGGAVAGLARPVLRQSDAARKSARR